MITQHNQPDISFLIPVLKPNNTITMLIFKEPLKSIIKD